MPNKYDYSQKSDQEIAKAFSDVALQMRDGVITRNQAMRAVWNILKYEKYGEDESK